MIDIFNPQVSVVAKGLEGKAIMVYGGNNLGKTKQACRMPKPFYLPFEKGLNAISGVPYEKINNWGNFKTINAQLTNPTTVAKARAMYSTIIFDEVKASATYCQNYICAKYLADSIKSGNDNFGLWKEYETEYWVEINKLLGAGYTVIFIAHEAEGTKNEGQKYPQGDKRALSSIVDNCDIVVYLTSNGIDDKRKVVNSSAHLAETKEYFARSRFDYIATDIDEFTAEALEKAISEAIDDQAKAEGVAAVPYEEQKSRYEITPVDFDTLMGKIKEVGALLAGAGHKADITKVVEAHLGKGKLVSECQPEQLEIMSVIYDELATKLVEYDITK